MYIKLAVPSGVGHDKIIIINCRLYIIITGNPLNKQK